MKNRNIEKLRKSVIFQLKKYKEKGGKDYIKIDIEKELLQQILFEDNKFALPDKIWKLLDLSNVSFDDIDVRQVDFTGSKGVVINPQTIKYKSLCETKLKDVEIDGSFYDVDVRKVNFTGSKGVRIDPQIVKFKSLWKTKLTDVEITGSFDDVNVEEIDFTGSKGAVLDPQTVAGKSLYGTKLKDVKIAGSLEDVDVLRTDFTGSKGAIIMDLDVVNNTEHANLTDVKIFDLSEYQKIEEKIAKIFQKTKKLYN